MNNELDEELGPLEREAFDRLAKEKTPPPFLEQRIVEALRRDGLIRPPASRRSSTPARVGLRLAASLTLFVAGVVAGLWWASAHASKPSLPEFMLVLREFTEQYQQTTSEEMMRRVKEYSAWAGEVGREGLLVGGEKLKDEGRLLSVVGGRAVERRQPELTENGIGGYFLIQARDYEHAVAIAEGCPHLKYGGTVEVRQIERF